MSSFVKPLTWILGVVLLLVGIAGFFAGGNLLGFQVDAVHDIIHILSGVAALFAVSTSMAYARWYLIIFGVIYGLVTILGFMSGNVLGLFVMNTADNYLHLAIAAVSLIVGFGSNKNMM